VVLRIGPQCFPSVEWHGRSTGVFTRRESTRISSYNLEDRDYLIKTVAFEAPNEPVIGKAAVVHVVLNRKKSGRWGENIKKIVTQPWQFEPWMTRRKEIENYRQMIRAIGRQHGLPMASLTGIYPIPLQVRPIS
jgi:Cell Wall Hydrolase